MFMFKEVSSDFNMTSGIQRPDYTLHEIKNKCPSDYTFHYNVQSDGPVI